MVEEGFIKLPEVEMHLSRNCIICAGMVRIFSPSDPTCICDDCRKYLNERNQSRKSNWIPNSKGGEPNCRRR